VRDPHHRYRGALGGREGVARLTRQQRLILVATALAVGLAFLDETAVVTALRSIQHEFDATSTEVQWVMGAYLLALASFMAAAGRLADLYGRRRLFLLGAALFGVGSIAAASAPSEEFLIAARVVQGTGGALLMPLGYANATAAFSEDRRGWTIGIVSMGATVFLALGPLVGGVLTDTVGWRWIFLINVPAIAAIVLVSMRFLPEARAPVREPLDVAGLMLLVGGLSALVLTLLNLHDWGLGSPATIALACASIALLGGFVLAEHRTAHPLVDLRLLRIRAVAGSLCGLFAIQFAIVGLTVYLTLYLQLALGYSPSVAGLLTLPTVLLAPVLSSTIGSLTDKVGVRPLLAGSLALAAIGLGLIWLLAGRREVGLLLPAFLAFGLARPTATIAGTSGTVGSVPREQRGLSSALATESRQIGAVLGVALLGLALTTVEIARRNQLLRGVDSTFGHRRREALDGILAGSSKAQQLLHALPPAKQHAATEAASTAFISGFRGAMLVTFLLLTAATVVSAILLRPTTPAAAPSRSATLAAHE
jgi:EmrB/QacA subfamily drug resistance transporter